MGVPSVNCTHCGKNLTTDDLRRIDCRHCGTVLPHHARAQQQVAVINQMMADRNGNGIPDAFEGIVANANANAMNQAFGFGGQGAPMGPMGPTYPMGYPPAPHGMYPHGMHPIQHVNHMNAATGAAAAGSIAVFVIMGVAFAMVAAGGAMAFFLMR